MNINDIDKLSLYPSNCLALTIKNNYKLTIGKNVLREGRKFTFRVFFMVVTLNILNLLIK